MQNRNIYIVLGVVVLLFIGFLTYRHFRHAEEQKAHHEDTYNRLTEMANKSPRVGMVDMARALNAYYAANNAYPQNLSALYPDYIGATSFIDNVKWEYRQSGNDFYLSKRVQVAGKIQMASIDRSLQTKMDTGTYIAKTEKPKEKAGTVPADTNLIPQEINRNFLATLKTPDFSGEEMEAAKDKTPKRIEYRTVSVIENEIPPVFVSSVSRSYLVWRDGDFHLGFGNIQYPRADRLIIADRDQWIRVTERPEGKCYEHKSGYQTAPVQDGKEQMIAMCMRGEYMAWKDKNGAIGFGNVQLPGPDKIASVYVDGRWQKHAAFGEVGSFQHKSSDSPAGKTSRAL